MDELFEAFLNLFRREKIYQMEVTVDLYDPYIDLDPSKSFSGIDIKIMGAMRASWRVFAPEYKITWNEENPSTYNLELRAYSKSQARQLAILRVGSILLGEAAIDRIEQRAEEKKKQEDLNKQAEELALAEEKRRQHIPFMRDILVQKCSDQ